MIEIAFIISFWKSCIVSKRPAGQQELREQNKMIIAELLIHSFIYLFVPMYVVGVKALQLRAA